MTYILSRYHSATAAWSPHCVCERTRKMRVLVSVYTSWTCFLRFINTVFGVAGQKVCLFTDLEAADEALSRDPNKEISSTEEWTAAYLYSIYVIDKMGQFKGTIITSHSFIYITDTVTHTDFVRFIIDHSDLCYRCNTRPPLSLPATGFTCFPLSSKQSLACLLYTSPSPRD